MPQSKPIISTYVIVIYILFFNPIRNLWIALTLPANGTPVVGSRSKKKDLQTNLVCRDVDSGERDARSPAGA
jgi:hypothetical protein